MVVVAIIGLCAAMSVPSILTMRREAPMRKAINDVLEVCERARAGAVLKGVTATLVVEPRAGKIELVNGDANAALTTRTGHAPLQSVQFDPTVTVDELGVNLRECTAVSAVPVNFYDNGTCDEMTLILLCGGERQMITLELTTGLASVKAL